MPPELEPHAIRDFLEAELSYPIGVEETLDEIGDVTIAAPNADGTKTIAELLAGVGEDEYGSADELTQMLHTMMPDEYVGRKFYDDRGDARGDPRKGEEEDQSF